MVLGGILKRKFIQVFVRFIHTNCFSLRRLLNVLGIDSNFCLGNIWQLNLRKFKMWMSFFLSKQAINSKLNETSMRNRMIKTSVD